MTEKTKELIKDLTDEGVLEYPVISVAGRKYYIKPYQSEVYIPQDLVDFVKRHPERDDVNRVLESFAESLLADIVSYLRDAIAVTAVEDSKEGDIHRHRLFLPVMMPADTIVRWYGNGDIEQAAKREERIFIEAEERKNTGKPYIFNLMEWDENMKKFTNPMEELQNARTNRH